MSKQSQQIMTAMVLALCLLLPLSLSTPVFAVETIVAVVNDDAITKSDLEDRMKLVIISAGMPESAEVRAKLEPQILNILIEERLKLQEAARVEAEVDENEVDAGFVSLAQSNNMSKEKFEDVLKRSKVSVPSLRDQIRAGMAWSKVVQQEVHPLVSISDHQLDLMEDYLKNGVGKTEYLVSDIFLAVDDPKEESQVRQLAQKLTREILDRKVPFPKIASQFSQSAGAASGGSLGWVQAGQLDPEIDEALLKMDEGDMSQPIRTLSGFHIVYLRQKRTIEEENMPSRDALLSRMGMEELDRQARRYLQDLKANAFIERRI